jgi:hypothetical protein
VLAWLTLPWLFLTSIAYWDAGLGAPRWNGRFLSLAVRLG